MALQTNAQNTYQAIGIREDLTDIVALIDPQETPFFSNIGEGKPAKQTKHEWQVQTLASPNKSNFVLEGDDAPTASSAVARVRMANICAISRKVGAVTGSDVAVVTAGISNELDNQKMLKGVELRRDMELILLNNQAYGVGGTTTARISAGISAYITNSDGFVGTTTQNYTSGSGDGTLAWNLANTTTRAMNLTALNGAMTNAYISGGKPTMLILPPTQKVAFSNLTLQSSLGGATQIRYNLNGVRPGALIGSVDTWLSNFGELDVMPDVQLASDVATTNGLNNTAFLIDPRYAGVSYLRRMFTEDLAKTGDSNKFEIIVEYTLEVPAPKAHAALYAIS